MAPIYLHLSSTDSINIHPENNYSDFTVELSESLDKRFKICLTEFHCETLHEHLFVFCDVIESSFLQNKDLPLLRIVRKVGEFQHLQFHYSSRRSIHRIRIFLTNEKLEVPLQNTGKITCTLMLVPY